MGDKFNKIRKELLKNPESKNENENLSGGDQIARILIMARLESELTQWEVAERLATSHSEVTRMESEKPGNLKTIEKYAEATGNRIAYRLHRVASNEMRR